METVRTTTVGESVVTRQGPTQPGTSLPGTAPHSELDAQALRPVAHWVLMPTGGGHAQLEMVWEIPDPMPPNAFV